MFPLLTFLQLFLMDTVVLADYCEFGWCEEGKEYCCGKNKCCTKTVDRRLYWGIVLLVIFILALAGLIRKLRSRNVKDHQYTRLSTEVIS